MRSTRDPQTYRVSADEVHPGIWVGNQAAATSCDFINSHGFTMIINCTSHLPNYHERCACRRGKHRLQYLRIPVGDPGPPPSRGIFDSREIFENSGWQGEREIEIMYRMMPQICRQILEERQRGGKVFIHCHAGMQRSAGLAAGYIMRYCCNPSWDQHTRYRVAVSVLVRNRPAAFYGGSSVNFRGALLDRPLLVHMPRR